MPRIEEMLGVPESGYRLGDDAARRGGGVCHSTTGSPGFAGASSSAQIPMAGGLAASSPCPPFHLIPTVGLKMLAERFQSGVDRKGDKAWNAVSSNQACLRDKPFAIERISHIIDHATKLRDKLQADDLGGMKEDDDAGAIAWAGIFLCCVVDQLLKGTQNESSSRKSPVEEVPNPQ
jgi:hypothetical protein